MNYFKNANLTYLYEHMEDIIRRLKTGELCSDLKDYIRDPGEELVTYKISDLYKKRPITDGDMNNAMGLAQYDELVIQYNRYCR